jgi:DNA-binding NarL/FixJ family response regulator
MNERILIADDHYVVRAGTALVLESAYPEILTIDFAENYDKKKVLNTSVWSSYFRY